MTCQLMTSAFSKASSYTGYSGYEAMEGSNAFMSLCLTLAGTKFSVPTSLHPLIRRQRLHDLLHEGLLGPLTLLSAPAGYGKTSVLSEWLLTSRMHLSAAWVSLASADDGTSNSSRTDLSYRAVATATAPYAVYPCRSPFATLSLAGTRASCGSAGGTFAMHSY